MYHVQSHHSNNYKRYARLADEKDEHFHYNSSVLLYFMNQKWEYSRVHANDVWLSDSLTSQRSNYHELCQQHKIIKQTKQNENGTMIQWTEAGWTEHITAQNSNICVFTQSNLLITLESRFLLYMWLSQSHSTDIIITVNRFNTSHHSESNESVKSLVLLQSSSCFSLIIHAHEHLIYFDFPFDNFLPYKIIEKVW